MQNQEKNLALDFLNLSEAKNWPKLTQRLYAVFVIRPSNFELKLIDSNSKNTFKLHTLTNSFIWYRSFLFKAFSYRKTERQKSESQMAALKNSFLHEFILTSMMSKTSTKVSLLHTLLKLVGKYSSNYE